MKVLMIAPTIFFSSRGASVRILEEIENLQRMGINVTICTYRKGQDVQGVDIRRIFYTPSNLRFGPTYHRAYLDILLGMLSDRVKHEIKPRIVHAHLHEGAFLATIFNRFPRLPIVLDAQGSFVGEMVSLGFLRKDSTRYNVLKKLEHRVLRKVDAIVVSSHKLKEIYLHDFEIANEKITVVEDGVNLEHFNPRERDAELAKALGIKNSDRVVVYLGSIEKQQGIETILHAAKKVLSRNKNVHFLIMGATVDLSLDDCQRLCSDLGISDFVTLTGKIDYNDAPQYLSLGDVAVAAKYSESESDGKVLTYMSMGLPVVCTDTQINRYFAGPNASYFKPQDSDSLAEQIEKMLDSLERKMIGMSLRERVEDNFSWVKAAEKIRVLYEGLL